MARKASTNNSSRVPTVKFHMRTRRRAAQRSPTPESQQTTAKETPSTDRLSTPTPDITPPKQSSTDSSPLSSPPTSVGSIPKSALKAVNQAAESSPKKRKVSFEVPDDVDPENAAPTSNKRVKLVGDGSADVDPNIEEPEAAIDVPPSRRVPLKRPPPTMFYAADGETRYRPADHRAPSSSSSPRKPVRGGGRGRGRGGRFPNNGGRGGRKARDNGDRDDSPEPPARKHVLTDDDREIIADLKARQHELKKFFQTVGTQQIEVLDLLAARDVTRLVQKPKAHKKVPEYDYVVEDLKETVERETGLFRKQYEMQVEHAEKTYEMEKELIEKRFRERIDMAQKEHIKGAEGELMICEKAHHVEEDDDHTEAGSDSDEDHFPVYHANPVLGPVRGYNSTRIIDEKPFQQQFANFDDQVRREYIGDDIIAPMARDLVAKNVEYKKEQMRKRTMNMTTLSEEAAKQLQNLKGYLIPRPMTMSEHNSFALSALADISEWVAQQHPHQTYEYVPLPKGTQFPANALEFGPLPGVQQRPPPPPPPPQQQQRRTLPRTPTTPQQYVFQPPQQFFGHPSQSMPPPPQPIPVTFVNSTVSSRKAGGKGGQRTLLPKM